MEKVKNNNFLKTFAAYNRKVGKCIELNDSMKLHEYQRSRSLFDFNKRSLCFQTKILFFSKTVGLFKSKIM